MTNESSGLRGDAEKIIASAIGAVLPDEAVRRALETKAFAHPVTVFAIGKAAWRMANAARRTLGDGIRQGIVVTKYGHSQGNLAGFEIIEAGHPVPDDQSVRAARRVLAVAKGLTENDDVLLLISGGGSALFECPDEGVTLEDIALITRQLLACGADIHEINCVRKRLSAVKGGRLAQRIAPARIFTIVVSDVIGDPLDVIASGPACPDESTCEEALAIAQKYGLSLTSATRAALSVETPKVLPNVETVITGNVTALCQAAARAAQALGYQAAVMDSKLDIEARQAGAMIAAHAREAAPPCALIWGGETVVCVRGSGMGGRNQEVALSAAQGIAGLPNTCVLAVGSDGTDGPTDAAGGIVTGEFYAQAGGDEIARHLDNNDAYPLLKRHGALLMTGPTGTNVNDLYMLLRK